MKINKIPTISAGALVRYGATTFDYGSRKMSLNKDILGMFCVLHLASSDKAKVRVISSPLRDMAYRTRAVEGWQR